jgi:hypothetical protein
LDHLTLLVETMKQSPICGRSWCPARSLITGIVIQIRKITQNRNLLVLYFKGIGVSDAEDPSVRIPTFHDNWVLTLGAMPVEITRRRDDLFPISTVFVFFSLSRFFM